MDENFKQYEAGQIPGAEFFEEDEAEDESGGTFGKLPSSAKEMEDIHSAVSEFMFGNKSDAILDSINKFMKDLEDIRTALIGQHFPLLLVNLLYFPFFLIVMLLNCIREGFVWWLIVTMVFFILMAAVGALCSMCFAAYRSIKIYGDRFDADGKPKKEEEKEKEEGSSGENNQFEGSQAEGGSNDNQGDSVIEEMPLNDSGP